LKILTTALFSVIILHKHLSRLQWVALFCLFIGVAVVQLQPTQATPTANTPEQSLTIGLSAICAASMMSGFAGVYFEKLLKHTTPSIFLRNVQLGVIGIVFGLIAMYINDGSKVCPTDLSLLFTTHISIQFFISPCICTDLPLQLYKYLDQS